MQKLLVKRLKSNFDIVAIATMCHEANRSWCAVNGDHSQKSWDDAEQWQRDSAIKGVEFRLNNPDAGDDAQHNAWMADKINDGWVYGEVKDAEKKTHPCLVSFHQLPEFQQKKDAIFCAIVDTLAFETVVGNSSNVSFAPPYRETNNGTMDFGMAVIFAKSGKKVARAGWNGAGMYALIMPGYPEGIRVNEATQKAHGVPDGTVMKFRPYWVLKTAQGDVATWAPSGSDSLAEDWIVVE